MEGKPITMVSFYLVMYILSLDLYTGIMEGGKIKFGNKVAEIVHASGECMELVELACFVNLLLCWIDHTHKQ